MAATHTPAEPAASPIRLLPLLAAIAIMLGITAWPHALSGPSGSADHRAAMALFWAMSAGFVSGVGFRPRFALWRAGFSGLACFIGIALAALRLLLIH
ncbi:MAG: cyd operon YbgE family protein [Gammaproteobacteria bacterium]|jgi:predicted membrane protein|nr:cyd operon YbgE family protein [Gammaproteobacteria bacterium]MBU0772236.1 cyd operon YbgE family protein [Gammaproteobacteria bacterium]MBU0855298.1 cyd operon YbgE family protein [Gammaproteobacteria bacterium]MBU1848363.1 cyd operon YbgE family protein [Gammaproteobacteria bacterium]